MAKTIHLVNGDSTAEILKKSNLKGAIIVWREMLCEGPITSAIGSDEFWMKRYDFFQQEFKVEKLEYYDKTIKEIVQLEHLESVDEIILWFEYDLFCQINLIAACAYLLKSFRKDVKYSLVCVGRESENEKLQTLVSYTPSEYKTLFENRVKLTRNNLVFADQCWKVYVSNVIEELTSFNFKHKKFEYLSNAIQQHLKRFPAKNGLNEIELKILNFINSNSFSEKEIVKALLIWQESETIYGFGDVQYYRYLNKLSNYYQIQNGIYQLNDVGLKKLNHGNN